MTKIEVNVELILVLESKKEWIRKVPDQIPDDLLGSMRERLIWIDKNGNSLTIGEDFMKASKMNSYPVKVYRQIRVSEVFDLTKKETCTPSET